MIDLSNKFDNDKKLIELDYIKKSAKHFNSVADFFLYIKNRRLNE